ncbi:MAG: helix-turn-helix domain-containing protein [Synechococcales bacterium]|nr:helix-turn-helix domain-containing protein [Synechococcales bacterium]
MTDYTQRLRSLMEQANLPSFMELGRRAEVTEWQINQLRQGKVEQMRLMPLLKISAALQVSLGELMQTFSHSPPSEIALIRSSLADADPDRATPAPAADPSLELDTLREEYQRLQARCDRQREEAWADFQQQALQTLESWLLYWPTAVQKAQTNPQMAAAQLVPLVRPVEKLLQEWQVEAIATVDDEVAYDPTLHQLLEGTAQPGERVRVRYVGYRQGDRLLHRARVSRV